MSSLPTVPSSSSRDANAPSDTSELSLEDQAVLAQAMRELERTSLAIRLSAIIGRQVSAIGSIIPANISEIANKAAEAAIKSGLNFSLRNLAGKPLRDRRRMHKSLAVLAGAAGGAFGFSSLPVELPFSTTIMLRSIADIARGEGEDLSDPKTALACLEVFALGGRADADKHIWFPEIDVADSFAGGAALETGYFAVLAILVSDRSRKLSLRPRRCQRIRAGACPLGRANWQLFWRCRLAKARRSKRSADRRRRRRGNKLRLCRSFPDDRVRPFHDPTAGTPVWSGRGSR